ncbi:MAG: ABC transporter permease [Huintestinicola sp.]
MKFGNLLKKELKELITPQAIAGMIFTCVLLIAMGQLMGGAMEEAFDLSEINICVKDDSAFTAEMLEHLEDYGSKPVIVEMESNDYFTEMSEQDISALVVIPEGFGEMVENGNEAAEVQFISLVNHGGMSAMMSDISASSVTGSISSYVTDYIRRNRYNMSDEEMQLVSEPVVTVEYTSANGKTAKISAAALTSTLMSQGFVAPFAVFFLLIMASQMIMTAISTEKIDKTLETLLSAPVSRLSVLSAKMVSALIVALLNSAFMIVGFVFYILGITGDISPEAMVAQSSSAPVDMSMITELGNAMSELGFVLTAGDIVLFGLQLFLTIAIGLAISLILGAMATDVKSVQTLTMPVVMITMLPFFATMFSDISSMSPVIRTALYIIPFTHTYTAMTNIMFGNTALFWGGLAYQLIFFVVCMFLAVRMFTTDRLFTMTLNPVKEKKSRKKVKADEEA